MTTVRELEDFNRGIERARAAYYERPTSPIRTTCGCGRRTSDRSGRCSECRRER